MKEQVSQIQVLFNWYIDMSFMKISRRGKSKATWSEQSLHVDQDARNEI